MTNFVRWRKMTWALVLWSGYVATWAVITSPGPAIVSLWWLVGVILLGSLWLARQPLFRQGRGPTGFFVRPGWTDWRVVNLHRTHPATEPARDAG
jgi:hypothetical protein